MVQLEVHWHWQVQATFCHGFCRIVIIFLPCNETNMCFSSVTFLASPLNLKTLSQSLRPAPGPGPVRPMQFHFFNRRKSCAIHKLCVRSSSQQSTGWSNIFAQEKCVAWVVASRAGNTWVRLGFLRPEPAFVIITNECSACPSRNIMCRSRVRTPSSWLGCAGRV